MLGLSTKNPYLLQLECNDILTILQIRNNLMNKKLTLLLGLITVMPGLQAAAEQKEKPLEATRIQEI